MSHDWYRNEEWNEEIEEAFFARLKRSRGAFHKAQYLRIQAGYIQNKFPEVSLRLIDLLLNEFPAPTELACAYLQKAKCLIGLSKPNEAVEWYRKVMEREKEYKNVKTNCYLDYAYFAVITERKDLFHEVKNILLSSTDRLTLPVDYCRYHMALAIIEWNEGNISGAKEHALAAMEAASLEHSGFRYHPKIGLVEELDEKIKIKLNDIINSNGENIRSP